MYNRCKAKWRRLDMKAFSMVLSLCIPLLVMLLGVMMHRMQTSPNQWFGDRTRRSMQSERKSPGLCPEDDGASMDHGRRGNAGRVGSAVCIAVPMGGNRCRLFYTGPSSADAGDGAVDRAGAEKKIRSCMKTAAPRAAVLYHCSWPTLCKIAFTAARS